MTKQSALVLLLLMTTIGFASDESKEPTLPQPQVKWKIELNYGRKQVSFGPDGTLYVATSGNDAVLTAMTPAGLVRWSWVAHRGAIGQLHFDHDKNILVLFGGRLVKLAPDGGLWWERKFYGGPEVTLGVPRGVSLTVAANGTSYVAAAYLNAYSAQGDLLWQFRGTQPMRSVHLLNGNIEATDGSKTYLISPEGKKISESTDATGSVFATSEGSVDYRLGWLQMGGYNGGENRSFNRVVAQSDGKHLWEFAPGIDIANVLPKGNTVFVGGKVLAALNSRDGSLQWRINTGNSIPVQTLRSGVVGGCEKGASICAYSGVGKLRWAFVGAAKAWYAPQATVAVGPDETIYIADDQKTLTAVKDVVAH